MNTVQVILFRDYVLFELQKSINAESKRLAELGYKVTDIRIVPANGELLGQITYTDVVPDTSSVFGKR